MSESPTRATEVTIHTEAPDDPVDGESGSSSSARVEADDEAFMDAWGSLKTYTLNAYSERYSPSIRHDGPNVRTYDADAVDALLARLRPAALTRALAYIDHLEGALRESETTIRVMTTAEQSRVRSAGEDDYCGEMEEMICLNLGLLDRIATALGTNPRRHRFDDDYRSSARAALPTSKED